MFPRTRHTTAGAVPFGVTDTHLYLQTRAAPQDADMNLAIGLRRTGDPPGVEDVRALLADAVERIPALGHRIAGRGGRRFFEPVDTEVRHHVEEVRCTAGRNFDECVMEAVERPWAPGRPPWSVQILSGYRAGEHALMYRVAHVLQDGLAAAMTVEALLEGKRLPPPPAMSRPVRRLPSLRELRAGLTYTPRFLRRNARWLPEQELPASGPWIRRTVVLDRALFDAIGRRTGASTAQICLAVLSGALRSWTPGHWNHMAPRRQRRGLPAYMTLSLRAPRDRNCLGNQVGMVPVNLPCAEPSPALRLRRGMRATDYGDVAAFRDLLARLLHPPRPLDRILSRAAFTFERRRPIVTIVPTDRDTHELGAEELFSVPVRVPDHDGGFVITPQPSTVTVSCVFSPVVGDTERLPGLVAQSLAELHAAVDPIPDRPTILPTRTAP